MGLSVEVTIDVTDKRGPLLSSTLQHTYEEHRGAIPETTQPQVQIPNDSSPAGQPMMQP
jgi:hypothetical protein